MVGVAAGPMAGRAQLVAVQWKANTTDPVAQDAYRQFRDRVVDQAAQRPARPASPAGSRRWPTTTKAGELRAMLAQALLFGAVLGLSLLFFRGPLAAVVPLLAIVARRRRGHAG